MAEFLLSLFSAHAVKLCDSLRGLDDTRRSLVTHVVSDTMAGKFLEQDRDTVSEHFSTKGARRF